MESDKSSNPFQSMWQNPNAKTLYQAAERITGPYAKELIEQSGIISSVSGKKINVLDQACGTGIVAKVLQAYENAQEKWHLTCTDLAEPMLDAVKELIEKNGWTNVETMKSDIMENGLESAAYDYAFASFVFMALPKFDTALDETLRVLKPGGTIAINTWKNFSWIEEANAAAATLSPDLPQITSEQFSRVIGSGEWDNPSWIESALRAKCFEDINISSVQKTVSLGKAEDVAAGALFPLRGIVARIWNQEQREKYGDKYFPALVEYLVGKYGKEDDVLPGTWEAIVTTAKKPL